MDVEAAKEDLKTRTLKQLGYDFARVIYLSSLRDFSTGEYFHHGLAYSFSESAATAALAACHQELFHRLTTGSLESFVQQLHRFIQSTPTAYKNALDTWDALEAYKAIVPSYCDRLTAALFRSNIKIGVALLKSRRPSPGAQFQSASPRRLLGQ